MPLSPRDLYRLASELAAEHGPAARDLASRTVMAMEAEGDLVRAQFWFVMLVMVEDIRAGLVDPHAAVTLH